MMVRSEVICAFSVLLLTSCSAGGGEGNPPDRDTERSGSKVVGASKEAEVEGTKRQPDNPAEREGVKVYRPKQLANTSYDQNRRAVVDLVITSLGHAGGPGLFSYRNNKIGPIASGSVMQWSNMDAAVYNITAISIAADNFKSMRAREEYDIARLAEMFRGLSEEAYRKAQPLSKTGLTKEILVVDSRPEKISEINPQNGMRKVAQ